MSMMGNYLRISGAELEAVLQSPEQISDFLYSEEAGFKPAAGQHLDIDKSWHLIHFLLTGRAWDGEDPLRNVVLGGSEIGDQDVGYGPARYLRPSQVCEISGTLSSISGDELWRRFDVTKVRAAEIYPSGWEGIDEERSYILENFEALKAFFNEAAQENEAMLLYLN